MVDFTIDSTIDGSVYVFGPNRSIFTRIFWICLFILSIYGLFYYIRGSYIKWLIEPDIITKSRMRGIGTIPEFAVTVCPQAFNTNSFTFMKKFLNFRETNNFSLSEKECKELHAYIAWCNNGQKYQGKYHLGQTDMACLDQYPEISNWTWTDIASILFKSHDGFETVSKDIFSSLDFNISTHNFLTKYGPCVTFDMLKKKIFKEDWINEFIGLVEKGEKESSWKSDSEFYQPDESHPHRAGLLNITSLTPADQACKENKFKVIIHQPHEIPTFHTQEVIDVDYGTSIKIVVALKSERGNENLRVLHPDVRQCYFSGEKTLRHFNYYTKYHCLLECLEDLASYCIFLEIPRLNRSKGFCMANLAKTHDEYGSETQKCKCYPTCNTLSYQIVKSESQSKVPENYSSFIEVLDESAYAEEIEKFITYNLLNCN